MPENDVPSLREFPRMQFREDLFLATWYPQGVFDDAFGDQVIDFIEAEERSVSRPFNRFADLDGLSQVRLRFGHTFQITERRRAAYEGDSVKTAIHCTWPIGFGLAHMYEVLMEGAKIQVRAFRSRAEAAEWLGVSQDALCSSSCGPDEPGRAEFAQNRNTP